VCFLLIGARCFIQTHPGKHLWGGRPPSRGHLQKTAVGTSDRSIIAATGFSKSGLGARLMSHRGATVMNARGSAGVGFSTGRKRRFDRNPRDPSTSHAGIPRPCTIGSDRLLPDVGPMLCECPTSFQWEANVPTGRSDATRTSERGYSARAISPHSFPPAARVGMILTASPRPAPGTRWDTGSGRGAKNLELGPLHVIGR
jgi:hypothetical protein